ncbi:MAG: hypothetical protein H0X07_01620 [Gemmatimonadales bacterium]|nr:hypothetical protein [Gemmatimonadales bacterium]
MTQVSAVATEAARQFWAHDGLDTGGAEELAAAADRVFVQLRAGLARWVGSEGYRALFHRALERVRAEHPALNDLSGMGGEEQEIATAVQAHGAAAVGAGIVALVATIVELLGRIVGEEMAAELVRQAGTANTRSASNMATGGRQNG